MPLQLDENFPPDGEAVSKAQWRKDRGAINGAMNHGGFFTHGAAGAVERQTENRLRDTVSVRDFGAAGDGVADDLPAFNAAAAYAVACGKSLFVPAASPVYRLTDTWVIGGSRYVDDHELSGDLAIGMELTNLSSFNQTVFATQQVQDSPIIFGEGERSVLWGDFPTTSDGRRSIVHWGIPGSSRRVGLHQGAVRDLTIIGQDSFDGGSFIERDDWRELPPTQHQVGLALPASHGAAVSGVTFRGLRRGFVSVSAYWSLYERLVFHACERACAIVNGNAIRAHMLVGWRSRELLWFDGGGSTLADLHGQECYNDLVIRGADTCVIGPGYLENTNADDGFAVVLGATPDATDVVHSVLTGLRVYRANGLAYYIHATRAGTFMGCRAYGGSVSVDATSYFQTINCDFAT